MASNLSKENMQIIYKEMNKSICLIECKNNKNTTGFFCRFNFPDKFNIINVLITDRYIIEKNENIKNKIIKLSLNNKYYDILIDDTRKIFIDKNNDIIYIEIKNSDGLNIDSFLWIDDNIFLNDLNNKFKNKEIYSIYFSNDKSIKFSYGKIK